MGAELMLFNYQIVSLLPLTSPAPCRRTDPSSENYGGISSPKGHGKYMRKELWTSGCPWTGRRYLYKWPLLLLQEAILRMVTPIMEAAA